MRKGRSPDRSEAMGLECKIHETRVEYGAILLFTCAAVVLVLSNLVSGCAPVATLTPPLPTPTPNLSPVPVIVPRPGYLVGRPTSPWGAVPEYKVIFSGPIESEKPFKTIFEASDYATFEFPVPDYGTYFITFLEPETDSRICEYQLILSPLESAVIGCDSGAWEAPWTDYFLE